MLRGGFGGLNEESLRVCGMSKSVLFLLFVVQSFAWSAEEDYGLVENELYRTGEKNLTDYQTERCRLDVYYPRKKKNFASADIKGSRFISLAFNGTEVSDPKFLLALTSGPEYQVVQWNF